MLFIKSFTMGVLLASAVGPIALLIIHYGLTHGITSGVKSAFGAALADFTFAVIAFSSGALLMNTLAGYERHIKFGASVVLVLFGLWLIREQLKTKELSDTQVQLSAHRILLKTYLLTIINPLTILVFMGYFAQMPKQEAMLINFLQAFALFCGSLFIQLVFAAGGAGLGKVIKEPKVIARLNIASGIGIAAFGVTGMF